jgi:hypothetical protein
MSAWKWLVMRRDLDRDVLIATCSSSREANAALRRAARAEPELSHWLERAPGEIVEQRVPLAAAAPDFPQAIVVSSRKRPRAVHEHRLDQELGFGAVWRATFDRDRMWIFDSAVGFLAVVLAMPVSQPHTWIRPLIALAIVVFIYALRLARTDTFLRDGYLVEGHGGDLDRGHSVAYTFDDDAYLSTTPLQRYTRGERYHLLVLPRFQGAPHVLALETIRAHIAGDGNLAWSAPATVWRLALPLLWLVYLLLFVAVGIT